MESVDPEPSFPYHHKTRRTLKSSRLQCRHCDDVFTSRVSFKLHQKRHMEEAVRVGALKGEKASRISDRAGDGESGTDADPQGPNSIERKIVA